VHVPVVLDVIVRPILHVRRNRGPPDRAKTQLVVRALCRGITYIGVCANEGLFDLEVEWSGLTCSRAASVGR
jgi:hypothetical protein